MISVRIDVGEGPGAPTTVDVVPFVIGREVDCDLVVEDPRVSRHHAQLEVHDDGRMVLRDLGSANGTFVHGERVEGGVWFQVPGTFKIGRTEVLVDSVAPEPDPEPGPAPGHGADRTAIVTLVPSAPVAAPVATPPLGAAAQPERPAPDMGLAPHVPAAPPPKYMTLTRVLGIVVGAITVLGAAVNISSLADFEDSQPLIALIGLLIGGSLVAVSIVLSRPDPRVWRAAMGVAIAGLVQSLIVAVILISLGAPPAIGFGFLFLVWLVTWLRREQAWWSTGARPA